MADKPAKDDDLFGKDDVTGGGDDAGPIDDDDDADPDDAGDDDADMTPDGGDSKEALISEASAEAAELGIMVPDDADTPEEWIEHFVTAVKTHKATKDTGDATADAGAPDAAGAGATPVEEPMTTVSMSMYETLKKENETMKRDIEEHKTTADRLSKVAANALLKDTLGRVNALVKTGVVSPARVAGWKQTLESKQMSLLTGKDGAIRKVITELAFAEEMAKDGGHDLLANRTDMSAARGEPTGADYFDEAKEAAKKKEQEDTTKEMLSMVNCKTA